MNLGNLRSANIVQAGERTRVVLNLKQAAGYTANIQGKSLLITLEGAANTAAPVPVAPQDPKLQEQLDRLEKRMDQLVAGFKAQGYIKDTAGHDGAELLATDFLPHPSTLPPPAPVAATTKVSAVVTPRRMAVRRAVARPAPAIPKPSHQLLSVDMWDGRPSVVVGVPGADAGQVRVLQPGDTYNGVTLTEVDVAGQRATFSNGGRSVSIGVERQP